MVFSRTGYQPHAEENWAANPLLGRAYILPWDTETFGFPVATYETGTEQLDAHLSKEFSQFFQSWTRRNGVQLCSCAIPAGKSYWKGFLPQLGFHFVDLALQVTLNRLGSVRLPETRTPLRNVTPGDREAIEAIAGTSFHHGRYHADPAFPQELADLRYRHWVNRALAGEHPIDRLFVMERAGSVQGFFHVTVEGELSDLRLAAVSPKLRGTMFGFDLYVSVLHTLRNLGVSRVVTSISATNTAVMNIYSKLGFQFSHPKVIYHWHPEGGTAVEGL